MPRKISFRQASHFLGGPGPPPCLPAKKKFALTRQKIRRAMRKVTARVPIFRRAGPKMNVV